MDVINDNVHPKSNITKGGKDALELVMTAMRLSVIVEV